jgi:GntR family transcriptional repressor for pyruvate dehydrogenase complex
MLKAAKANRVFEDIIHQIEDAITSREFKPGDKLPPERELQKTLETSRPTLREALRVLEQKGLIEIRTGAKGGAFIKAAGVDRMSENLALLIHQRKVSLKHLFEFRLSIEGLVTGLAARNATTKDLKRLTKHINGLAELLEEGSKRWKEFYVVESLLHQAIPEMSRNPIFDWILQTVHSSMWIYYEMLPHSEQLLRDVYRDWCEIVDAIKEKDEIKAAGVANAHVVTYNRYLEETDRIQRLAEDRKMNVI